MSRSKGDAGPVAVVSVMDRLKQLYFEKIRPLEEAYAFGEFYSCVAIASRRASCLRALFGRRFYPPRRRHARRSQADVQGVGL